MKIAPIKTYVAAALIAAAPLTKSLAQNADTLSLATKNLTEDTLRTASGVKKVAVVVSRNIEETYGKQQNGFTFGIKNKLFDLRMKPDSAQAAQGLKGKKIMTVTNEFLGAELVENNGIIPKAKASMVFYGNQAQINPHTKFSVDWATVVEAKGKPSQWIEPQNTIDPWQETGMKLDLKTFTGLVAGVKNEKKGWSAHFMVGPEWAPFIQKNNERFAQTGHGDDLAVKMQAGFVAQLVENAYLFINASIKGAPGVKATERSAQAGFLFRIMKP